jgi:hypothetical protein
MAMGKAQCTIYKNNPQKKAGWQEATIAVNHYNLL